jgi:TolB-like protein
VVAVLPFEVLSDGSHQWMGRAVQESLASGVQGNQFQTATVSGNSAVDNRNRRCRRQLAVHGDFVIFGSMQVFDDHVRIDGRVLRTADGSRCGAITYQGEVQDLFSLEDLVTQRALRLLTATPPTGTRATTSVHNAPPTLQLVGPTVGMPSKYFDGDLASTLAVQPQFQDEANRFNYHPSSCGYYFGFGCGYGFGYGCFGSTRGCAFGGPIGHYFNVVSVSTW